MNTSEKILHMTMTPFFTIPVSRALSRCVNFTHFAPIDGLFENNRAKRPENREFFLPAKTEESLVCVTQKNSLTEFDEIN
jgi:hypothetical protein